MNLLALFLEYKAFYLAKWNPFLKMKKITLVNPNVKNKILHLFINSSIIYLIKFLFLEIGRAKSKKNNPLEK